MTKTQYTAILNTVFRCDAHQCTTKLTVPAHHPYNAWKDQEATDRYASGQGWSRWHNRSTYFYCPIHKPKSPNVRKIW